MGSLYERRLLEEPSVHLEIPDLLSGIVSVDNTTVTLDNTDGFFNTSDLRGTVLTIDRFDRADQYRRTELVGAIVRQEISGSGAVLTLSSQDAAVLKTLLPKRLVTIGTFPKAHSEQGLNRPIPIVFGNTVTTEMLFVGDDTAANTYDYLVCEGTPTISAILRDTVGNTLAVVPAAEYAINDLAYPGFRVVRFTSRQVKFGGGMHRLFATVNGLSAERNFATAVQSILSNSTWGLGESVDTAAFSSVATALSNLGSLYCDGVIRNQQSAMDLLSDLLMIRGMRLRKTGTGIWTISLDQRPGIIRGSFGHGKDQPWRNVIQFNGLRYTPVDASIKTLTVEYQFDEWASTYPLQISRSALSVGKEERIPLRFVRDSTTADKIADYLSKRITSRDKSISFVAGQEAADLIAGDLIRYEAPDLAINDNFQVQKLVRTISSVDIEAYKWSASDYTYTAGTLPADPTASTDTDYSRSTPTAASALSIADFGIESDGQGGFSAFVVLQYTVPNEPWAQTVIRKRRTGATSWETAGGPDQATGVNKQTKVTNLITGLNYDYQISRVNLLNSSLFADTTLTSQTASVDSSGPAAPTSLAVVDQHLKTIRFSWVAPADKDIKYYHWEVRTGAAGGGVLVVEGNTEGPGTEWGIPLNQIAYSTTYYLRIRGHDWSGNTGTYSGSLGFSLSQIGTIDIGAGQVVTSTVGANQITIDAGYSSDTTTTLNTSTEVEIATITLSTNGGTAIVFGKCNIQVNIGGGALIYLRKDSITGTILDSVYVLNPGSSSELQVPATLLGYDAVPGSAQTYKLSGILTAGVGNTSRKRMYAANLKR